MRRWLLTILLFLLLGAMVNVAVAWAIAEHIDPYWLARAELTGDDGIFTIPHPDEVILAKAGSPKTLVEFIRSLERVVLRRRLPLPMCGVAASAWERNPLRVDGEWHLEGRGFTYAASANSKLRADERWRSTLLVGWPCRAFEISSHAPQTIEASRWSNLPYPHRIKVPGFLINTASFGLLLCIPAVAATTALRLLRHLRGRCLRCGYRAGSSSVCTECGHRLSRQRGNR